MVDAVAGEAIEDAATRRRARHGTLVGDPFRDTAWPGAPGQAEGENQKVGGAVALRITVLARQLPLAKTSRHIGGENLCYLHLNSVSCARSSAF